MTILTKRQILASQLSSARSRNNERQLEKELQRFFKNLGKDIQANLEQYWSDNLLMGQISLIVAPILESQPIYYSILEKYDKREYKLGIQEAERLVLLVEEPIAQKSLSIPRLFKRFDLFATLRGAEKDLLERVFTASTTTLTRVNSSIKTLLTEGYQSGNGINKVANQLTRRFDQLQTWEAKRIARTEIHNSHNKAVMDTYKEYDVEYTMWISSQDDRVRSYEKGDKADHLILDGEIIRLGDTYSNGLHYPGDTDGKIVEWINCRCRNAPYVVPYGYMAPPGMKQFHEEDLIKVETKLQETEQ